MIDFKEKCKYNLAPGNDSLKSNWKFRDYAPSIFERIRRRFGI